MRNKDIFVTSSLDDFSFSFGQQFKQATMMSFYDAVYPIHLVSKISGVSVFTINFKTASTRFSKSDLLLIVASIAANYYVNVNFWSSFDFSLFYHSTIIRTSLPILYYGKYLINVIAIIWSVAMRSTITRLLIMIHDIDEMVKVYFQRHLKKAF